eukprot:TRINITY_DN7555_c0_g1_i1.p2 TRINITY_DN7555_c0_g1~~TRINITY_DN7555_c0_g1_i1.p2  ORF type:complete len:251 (+),score=70.41 TRINITY_DN7555_c0_g1_i1:89-841(+)
MSEQPARKSGRFGRITALAAAAFGAAAWMSSSSAPTFVGAGLPKARTTSTQMNGYRLDWMLEKKDGTNDLQVMDGFFIGEKGFEKSQNAQGFRYRMRPMPDEYKNGIETDGLLWQFGPVKIKLGEAFGGSGVNDKLRALKRAKFKAGLTDPAKIEENEYWRQRYGHKRWNPPYIDQSNPTAQKQPGWGFGLRGMAAWSGYDPLGEERGKTWIEADYGKPWLQKYKDFRLEGGIPKEQAEKENNSGKLLKA